MIVCAGYAPIMCALTDYKFRICVPDFTEIIWRPHLEWQCVDEALLRSNAALFSDVQTWILLSEAPHLSAYLDMALLYPKPCLFVAETLSLDAQRAQIEGLDLHCCTLPTLAHTLRAICPC